MKKKKHFLRSLTTKIFSSTLGTPKPLTRKPPLHKRPHAKPSANDRDVACTTQPDKITSATRRPQIQDNSYHHGMSLKNRPGVGFSDKVDHETSNSNVRSPGKDHHHQEAEGGGHQRIRPQRPAYSQRPSSMFKPDESNEDLSVQETIDRPSVSFVIHIVLTLLPKILEWSFERNLKNSFNTLSTTGGLFN